MAEEEDNEESDGEGQVMVAVVMVVMEKDRGGRVRSAVRGESGDVTMQEERR